MKSFQVVFDPDENVSEEDAKRMEEEIREHYSNIANGKKSDDIFFDFDFNEAIESKFYEAESDYVMFDEMEYNFNSIYLYFQYTRRYVAFYEADSSESIRKQIASYEARTNEHSKAAEVYDYYENWIPGGELIHLNCQSTLLMLYSVFEAFLRQLAEFLDDKAGILKCPFPYDDYTTLKYLDYLNYKKHIFIPKELYLKFSEIRLVRNYYAHSLDKPQTKLLELLDSDPYGISVGCRIVVNEGYIEHAFEVLGKMVKAIETAFKKNYPKLQ